MARVVLGVVAPFLALALVMVVAGAVAGSDVFPLDGARIGGAPAPTGPPTTVIWLGTGAGGVEPGGTAPGGDDAHDGGEGDGGGLGADGQDAGTEDAGDAPAPDATTPTTMGRDGSETADTTDGETYTVAPGDNPYEIARRFDVAVEDLMALNGIGDPHELQVGAVLRIPPRQ